MKKSKIVLLVTVLICTVMILSSCGQASFKRVYGGEWKKTPSFTSAQKVDQDLAGDIKAYNSGLLFFEENVTGGVTRTVYNAISDRVVYKTTLYTDEATVIDITLGKYQCFTVYDSVHNETTLYDKDGVVLVKENGNISVNYANKYQVQFALNVFRVFPDTQTFSALPDLKDTSSSIPSCDISTFDFYYDTDDGMIMVYDIYFKIVASYSIPSYAKDCSMFVLADGNVFIQYIFETVQDASKYDFTENGSKYIVKQLILNVKKNTVKNVSTDFIVDDVVNRLLNPEMVDLHLSDGVENVATVYYIKDKHIDESNQSMSYISLSNSGKNKGSLDDYIVGQVGIAMPIADGRYVATDCADCDYLLDGNGAVIMEVNNTNMNMKYIWTAYKVYDMNGSVLYDLKKNNMSVVSYTSRALICENENDFYVFTNGDMTKLYDSMENKSITRRTSDYFEVYDSDNGEYTYYNDAGMELLKLNYRLQPVTVGTTVTQVFLFKGYDSRMHETVYYRFY